MSPPTPVARRGATWLAWSLFAVVTAAAVAGTVLQQLNGSAKDFAEYLSMLAYPSLAAVGALVVSRRPQNAIGWLFLAIALFLVAGFHFPYQYARYALVTEPGSLPGGMALAWLSNWGWYPSVALLGTFALLLFPDGRLPSRRWRPVAWLAAAAVAVPPVALALSPGPVQDDRELPDNPTGIAGAEPLLEAVVTAGFALGLGLVVASAISLVGRFRRSRSEERQQLKWFMYAAALFAASQAATIVGQGFGLSEVVANALFGITITLFPIAAGIAIFKHRLYDIDLVINRTLVYAGLTATLAGAYLGSVLLLQLVLSPSSDLAIAGSTLAVAALFRPARARIQEIVDRRFYRRRYDAARTLQGFGVRLRDEIDLGTLDTELSAVVRETLQPAHVSLWLRTP